DEKIAIDPVHVGAQRCTRLRRENGPKRGEIIGRQRAMLIQLSMCEQYRTFGLDRRPGMFRLSVRQPRELMTAACAIGTRHTSAAQACPTRDRPTATTDAALHPAAALLVVSKLLPTSATMGAARSPARGASRAREEARARTAVTCRDVLAFVPQFFNGDREG